MLEVVQDTTYYNVHYFSTTKFNVQENNNIESQ